MNRTTSSHLARSVATDHWTAADRDRVRRTFDAETPDDTGHEAALSGWASRLQSAVSLLSRRTAAERVPD